MCTHSYRRFSRGCMCACMCVCMRVNACTQSSLSCVCHVHVPFRQRAAAQTMEEMPFLVLVRLPRGRQSSGERRIRSRDSHANHLCVSRSLLAPLDPSSSITLRLRRLPNILHTGSTVFTYSRLHASPLPSTRKLTLLSFLCSPFSPFSTCHGLRHSHGEESCRHR